MTEKFTVIKGGKTPEQNPLSSSLVKIKQAIASFENFDDLSTELPDLARYNDMSDSELAYEAELLSKQLKNPNNVLTDLLIRAIALRECIMFRLPS